MCVQAGFGSETHQTIKSEILTPHSLGGSVTAIEQMFVFSKSFFSCCICCVEMLCTPHVSLLEESFTHLHTTSRDTFYLSGCTPVMGNCSTATVGKTVRRTSTGNVALGKQLYAAVRSGDHDLVKQLLADGAPVNAKDDRGETPLHAAVFWGNVEMVQLLVAEGADKDAPDGGGFPPLHSAAHTGRDAVAETLLAAGEESRPSIWPPG